MSTQPNTSNSRVSSGCSQRLERLEIKGYKSIREVSLDLKPVNVLIGQNGAGKSNFVSFLGLLQSIASGNLQLEIVRAGGANALLHYGSKTTQSITATLWIRAHSRELNYQCELVQGDPDNLALAFDQYNVFLPDPLRKSVGPPWNIFPAHLQVVSGGPAAITRAQLESDLSRLAASGNEHAVRVHHFISTINNYHFHDTSRNAPVRQHCFVHDDRRLASDAHNLPALLLRLRRNRQTYYSRILDVIRQISPFFGDFVLEPSSLSPDRLLLRWQERGNELVFGPHQLSDGTLRVMALVTLLLQPEEDLPPLLVIDEPELGLHPRAIEIIAGLIRAASEYSQIIVATQSPLLVDFFEPQDIIVVDRGGVDREIPGIQGPESRFRRLDPEKLKTWLEEYSLSSLWQSNMIGGGPGAWIP